MDSFRGCATPPAGGAFAFASIPLINATTPHFADAHGPDRRALEKHQKIGKARVSSKYAERQAKIIKVATRIINRRGVSGMTLAQVAAEMGMTPANIAYYFKTKEDLAVASFLTELPRLIGIFDANSEVPFPESITDLIDNYFSYVSRIERGLEAELVSPNDIRACLLYTSPSPRDRQKSRMPSSA